MRNISIKWRMTLWFSLLMIAITALMLVFVMLMNRNSVTRPPEAELVHMVERNADDVEFDHGDWDFSDVEQYAHGVYTEIFDENGQRLLQWPQPTHLETSTAARLSLTTIASAGHSLWHFMQPMQPKSHIFMTFAPLSILPQAGMIFWLSGISFMMLLGQASAQAPQPTQRIRLTLATPSTICIASNWQALVQLPRPMQAKVQVLLLLPPKSMAA